jgi:hypothetical protein
VWIAVPLRGDDEVVLYGSEKLLGQAIHIHNIIRLLAHALRFAEPPRFPKARGKLALATKMPSEVAGSASAASSCT